MKEKVRRVVALIGIFVLVGMYVFTVIAAIMDNPATMKILAVSIALTIIIPIILYVLSIFIRGGREDVLTASLRNHSVEEGYDRNSTNVPENDIGKKAMAEVQPEAENRDS